VRAFAVAQSGLLAAQGLGILTGGAVAQRIGPTGAVALAGLLGLLAAAALATDWTRRHTQLISMLISGRETAVAAAAPSPGETLPTETPPAETPATGVPAAEAPITGAPVTQAPLAAPPVLNLPVAERGTGRSAPPQPAGTTENTATAKPTESPASVTPVPERAPEKGLRRGSAHRAPRELSVRARLAATRLLDQVLGDRRALPFLWDDDPRREVHQHEDAESHHRQGNEDQPDHGGVDTGVLAEPGADAGHEPTFPCPD
jgi:hypothetical protein